MNIAIAIIIALIAIFLLRFLLIYLKAKLAQIPISLFNIFGIWLRNINPNTIVNALIQSKEHQLHITQEQLEIHHISRGNIKKVIQALIKAKNLNLPLDYQLATALELAGRDLFQDIQNAAVPTIIHCPNPQETPIKVHTKDQKNLHIRLVITAQLNLPKIISNATQETIIAKAKQYTIAAAITQTQKNLQQNPQQIAQYILEKQIDQQTMYTIQNIEITHVE